MIYTRNFQTVFKYILPKILRNINILSFSKVLTAPIQTLHDYIFSVYLNGVSAPNWSSVTAYNKDTLVIYKNRKVYKCLINNTNQLPTNTAYWKLYSTNFIGAIERSKYNSQKILFKYALNKYFQCVGINVFTNISNYLDNAFIYFPLVVYNGLSTVANERNVIAREFCDIYFVAGKTYVVVTDYVAGANYLFGDYVFFNNKIFYCISANSTPAIVPESEIPVLTWSPVLTY